MLNILKRGAASALILGVLASVARANQANPSSGPIRLTVGQKRTITVSGFGGCKFGVMTDGSGATVEVVSKAGESKKQKVTLVGLAPGAQTVTLTTTGETKGCEGFEFVYQVTVDPNPKDIAKPAGAIFKEVLASHRASSKVLIQLACDAIADTLDALKLGELSGSEAFDELNDIAIDTLAILAHDADIALNSAFAEVWGLAALSGTVGMNQFLIGFAPGGCGPWDKFDDRLQSDLSKAVTKLEGKLKRAEKAIDKVLDDEDDELLALFLESILGIQLTTPVPVPGGDVPVPAPPKALSKNWTASGRLLSESTGRLSLGGSADPANGTVNVTIDGPGDPIAPQNPLPDAEDCSFRADFAGLEPGVYTVTMSQAGGDSLTFTVLVP